MNDPLDKQISDLDLALERAKYSVEHEFRKRVLKKLEEVQNAVDRCFVLFACLLTLAFLAWVVRLFAK